MDKEQMKVRQTQYETWIDELDVETKELKAHEREDFEEDRDSFKEQVAEWKDSAEDHWDEFEIKLSRAWNKMREKWHVRKGD